MMTISRNEDIPLVLRRGWRESLRNGSWYRRCGGWVGIVTAERDGYRLILRRTERTLDDALDIANEILRNQTDPE